MGRRQAFITLFSLGLLALSSLLAGLGCGPDACQWVGIYDGGLWSLRGPRTFSAFVVGGLLALAGALMQLLLRNPLADPYVLGISGGAATGAMLLGFFLTSFALPVALQFGALAGSGLATVLLLTLSWRALDRQPGLEGSQGTQLILTGVMISAGFSALITLLLSLSSDSSLRGSIFWLMGDLDLDEFPFSSLVILAITSLWVVRCAPQLNVLVHGEATAQLLGIRVQRLRMSLLLVASLTTAVAVSVAGTIGFVGLVVPHVLRLWLGNDQRVLLPAAVLTGGSGLVMADLTARTIVAPVQLPVGVVTALIGVPVFLYLLNRSRT